MKLTQKVVIASIAWFVLWVVGTGGYELWTLTNAVPNDTISHVVATWTAIHPATPYVVVLFGGAFVAFWVTVVFHWWGKGFWWKPAKFIEEKKEDVD